MMQCWRHKRYKGVREPKADCAVCWLMYQRHQHTAESIRKITDGLEQHVTAATAVPSKAQRKL